MIESHDLLALIDDDDIKMYLNGESGDAMPSWDEIKLVYIREGREGVHQFIARGFFDAFGHNME